MSYTKNHAADSDRDVLQLANDHLRQLAEQNTSIDESNIPAQLRNLFGHHLSAQILGMEFEPDRQYAASEPNEHPWEFAGLFGAPLTFVSRHPTEFDAVIHNVIPAIQAEHQSEQSINIAFLGPATGEEMLHFCAKYLQKNADDTHEPTQKIHIQGMEFSPAVAMECVRRIHALSPVICSNAYDSGLEQTNDIMTTLNRFPAYPKQTCRVMLDDIQKREAIERLGSCDIIFINHVPDSLDFNAIASHIQAVHPNAFIVGTTSEKEFWNALQNSHECKTFESPDDKLSTKYTIAAPKHIATSFQWPKKSKVAVH